MRYLFQPKEELALKGLLLPQHEGIRAALLEGPPGCGKTALTRAVSERLGSPYVYGLLHSWTDADELFVGINVPAAVAGEADHVRQDGLLAVAARLSMSASVEAPVVLCLDEVDKVQERTENLLLDFLQTGRVPVRPGEHLQARTEALLVFLTSNGTRPLSDPLLRRVRRVRMDPLPVDLQDRVVLETTGAPASVVTTVAKAAREAAKTEGNPHLSVQEVSHAVREAWEIAQSVEDLREVVAAWACRTQAGATAVLSGKINLCPVWAEIVAARRRKVQ